ncbi:DUF1929 domain-containing protein [Streptomyces sp. NBC_00638]|uniref:galactose oxidase-like domain-containing protein n=1 Tax=Streptomyces sp. NBC_00638 TaxID=2975794 RepID=UPI00225121F3|nr:galactose oxidase-like domain-containing protein [Streptomyces sp. NBC_00638]MCX5006699.1 DUF1929 domain-containing protein [Streptomyces sp. NBC_00638]
MADRPSRLTTRKVWLGAGAVVALVVLSTPAMAGFAQHAYHRYESRQPAYKARYGSWAVTTPKYRLNPLHAILLHTGKVLLIAGPGDNAERFDGDVPTSTVWDPSTGSFKQVDAPADLFGGGHTQLADGKVLIAGGTTRQEAPKSDVKRAGGTMTVKNEDPDHARFLPRATVFRSTSGVEYRSRFAVRVAAAKRNPGSRSGNAAVTAGAARVFVEAVEDGARGVTNTTERYAILGLKIKDGSSLYGSANRLGLDKTAFQGSKDAYEFDPMTEKYTRVGSLNEARWHPALTPLPDGRALAVSGLDGSEGITSGTSEIYDPGSSTWSSAPAHFFPAYPSLFLVGAQKIFYSGSNAGYGPSDLAREPGLWDLRNNIFTPVDSLKDPEVLESSSSVLLPPAQENKVMVLGGGGVGESRTATSRTAIVDLDDAHPTFKQGPRLPQNTRYLNSVLMPDDTVFTTGGSTDYRGRDASDVRKAQFYLPATNSFTPAADPTIGRDHHSEALLLPDGRVAVFGSDPLFSDKANSRPGRFEQRIEVYSPPYLFRGVRPHLKHRGGSEITRGGEVTFSTSDAGRITRVRLMRPGSATHVTDFDQRSIALDITRRTSGSLTVRVPDTPSLVPYGWYMAFATDPKGIPSTALWLHVRPTA